MLVLVWVGLQKQDRLLASIAHRMFVKLLIASFALLMFADMPTRLSVMAVLFLPEKAHRLGPDRDPGLGLVEVFQIGPYLFFEHPSLQPSISLEDEPPADELSDPHLIQKRRISFQGNLALDT